jgi:1,4-dihydroxy-2-naphthoate polyprenyltransferase
VAWAYTGGPKPLAYLGLGECCAFVFYGVVPVCGAYFVQTGVWSAQALALSIVPGLYAANILMANNIRDIRTDARAGKRTMPVRLGERVAKRLFVGIVAAAVLCTVLLPTFLVAFSPAFLLKPLTSPLAALVVLILLICVLPAWNLARQAWHSTEAAYNLVLIGTVKLLLLSSVLLSAVLVLVRLLRS